MKYLLVLLGVTVIFACPIQSSAAPAASVNSGRHAKWLVRTVIVGKGKGQAIYYYTNITLTGSNLPLVLRECEKQIEIVTGAPINGRLYGADAIKGTGLVDVGAGLAKLDPSVRIIF